MKKAIAVLVMSIMLLGLTACARANNGERRGDSQSDYSDNYQARSGDSQSDYSDNNRNPFEGHRLVGSYVITQESYELLVSIAVEEAESVTGDVGFGAAVMGGLETFAGGGGLWRSLAGAFVADAGAREAHEEAFYVALQENMTIIENNIPWQIVFEPDGTYTGLYGDETATFEWSADEYNTGMRNTMNIGNGTFTYFFYYDCQIDWCPICPGGCTWFTTEFIDGIEVEYLLVQ